MAYVAGNFDLGVWGYGFNIADPEGAITGRVADLTGGYIIIVIR